MKLLFLNRSYWPDVEATGQLLTELCGDLARRHHVTVIAGQPNFVRAGGRSLIRHETHQDVHIIRVRNSRFSKKSLAGRVLGLSGYLLLAAWSALRQRRPHVLVVETDPPVLGALGALLKAWHGCGLVYYLQDLYPEVGMALGKLRPGPLTWFLQWATQLGLRHADRVVVLGEDMRRRVLDRGISAEKIVLVPNWVDVKKVRPLEGDNRLRKEWRLDGRFVIMYSGNLGLSQNLEQILLAAREMRGDPVHFLFVGDGAAKARLETLAGEWELENVSFRPYQPKEALSQSLGVADVHLIPLQKGLAGCIVPSKLYGILAAGKPYIAAVDADSEVARITADEHTGLVIPPDSVADLVAAVQWCLTHSAELAGMGRRGRQVAVAHFDRNLSSRRFADVLDETIRHGAADLTPVEPAWPRVSVIVPLYNQAAFVKESLDSIVQTRYPDLEIVVVNDGSKDDSPAAVMAWIKNNPGTNVRFLDHPRNCGVSKTLNDGVRAARGAYVCILAADDLLLPNGIADRVRYLIDRPQMLAVFADCHVIAPDGTMLYESGIEGLYAKAGMRKDALVRDELVADNVVRHWAVPGAVLLCRIEAFRVVGHYDESLKRCDDWDMYLRLSATGRLGFLPGYVAKYRVHPASIYHSRFAEVDADNYRAARKNTRLFRGELAEHLLAHVRRYEAEHPPKSLLKDCARLVNRALFRLPGYFYRGFLLPRHGRRTAPSEVTS